MGAHPDDIEFGCGATLAKWAAAGCRIHHLVCTDGSKGTWDADDDLSELVLERQREQSEASRRLGGDGAVTFLGIPDGELQAGLEERAQVAYCIRSVKPDVVLGHDPWKRYRLHPDHRSAGFLVTDGIIAARDSKFFPEQDQAPHRPTALLLFEADEPNHLESSAGYEQKKIDALLAHVSQFRSTMNIDNAGEVSQVEEFRRTVLAELEASGGAIRTGRGERFRLITDL